MKANVRATCGVISRPDCPGSRQQEPKRNQRRPKRFQQGRSRLDRSWAAFRWFCLAAFGLLSFTFCLNSLAQTQPAKVLVDDVVVFGNRTIPTARIMREIRTRPGAEFNQTTVNEDVRRLTETRLLDKVWVQKIERPNHRILVEFHCTEYPSIINEIIYKNAHHLKQDELESITGLKKGAPLIPAQNQMARKAIQDRLVDDGRMFATVVLEEGGRAGDRRVVFNISEGPVVRVRSINFTGVTFVSEARLNTQVDTSRAFLGLLGGKYRPSMVDHDVGKLEEYYRSFGYLDARVTREVKYSPNIDKVDITFHVHEGKRYLVSGVQVDGIKHLDPGFVSSFSQLKKGEPYNKHFSDKYQAQIKNAYGYRGREALIQEKITVDHKNAGFVQVHYEVIEKPPARVGEIKMVGNTVTQDRVILHEVPLFPGQILSYPALREAEKNLARRNIFEMNGETGVRPTVTVIDPDSDTPIKDILVQVQETHTGSLLFGVGVNSDAGLVGSIVLNERNFDLFRPPTSWADILEGRAFRGAGQEFRIEAVPGTQLQRYTVSFREPYLFDTNYALGLSGYYYDRIYNEYTERRVGMRVTVDRQLNQVWAASVGMRLENVNVSNFVFFAPFDFQKAAGDNFLIAPRIGLRRDDRDSYLRPTEGSLFEVSYEQVLGDFNFPVFNAVASKYWTTYQRPDGSGRHVLAFRSQFGWEGSEAPIFERFYAGGFQSLRGFEFRGVGPDVNGFKVGGDFLFLNSLEYQIPVRANDQLYFVAFVDSGTVERRLDLKDYRVSAGFGARIVVPMLGPVPIALDFGFPIVKGPGDNEQVFSFWVGMFR
jgi:outer membrane protein assembly complex protein YaeT